MRSLMTILLIWALSLAMLQQVSFAGILSDVNDLGIPYEEHKPVSHLEPHRYKREFRRVHPIMGNTTYTYDAMMKQHVVLVTPEKGIVALECARDSLELYLTPNVNIHQFKVGAVVVGGPEYQCSDEDGDLTAAYHEILQVVGVFNSSGYQRSSVVVRLITKEVTLMDLFHYARVHVHHKPHHQKPSHALMDPNSEESLAMDKRFGFAAGLDFRIGSSNDTNKPFLFEADVMRFTCDKCYFQFYVEFEFVLDFSYWWLFPTGVDRFKVFFGGEALLNMDFSMSFVKATRLARLGRKFFTYNMKPITFSIGPVPVVIVPALELSARVDVNIEASMSLVAGFDFLVNASLGVEYTSARGFETIRSFGRDVNIHKPNFFYGGKFYVRAYLVPAIVAKIYGIFPISLSVQPFVEFIAEVLSSERPTSTCGPVSPEFRIDRGLQLVVAVEPFNFRLFKVSFGGLLPLTATFNLVDIVTEYSLCIANPSPTGMTTVNVPRYYIKTGAWGPCSAYCGPGIKTRDVYCSDFTLPSSKSKVASSFCNGTFPSTTESCDLRECRPCGGRTCGACVKDTGCSWCFDHGGRCDVSSAVNFCKYNTTGKCPDPVAIKGAVPSHINAGDDFFLTFTGGLSNEAYYIGFSYDAVKWYYGGLFLVPAPYHPRDVLLPAKTHYLGTKYTGCLPEGNVTLGVFSQITQHTAFTSLSFGPPRNSTRDCLLLTPYNTCSRTCGTATQTQNYTCYQNGVEGCDRDRALEYFNRTERIILTRNCQGNLPCVDKPMHILKPRSIDLVVNKQKLFISWIGGEDYQNVNIAYRYMKDFYNQTYHSWIPFPQNPFANTGTANISMASGYPAHTFYQVQVCSSVNQSNCDVSATFSVTKPVRYTVRIIKADSNGTASTTPVPTTTAAPVTTPAPSAAATISISLPTIVLAAVKPTTTPAPAPSTNFTAIVTLKGVALNHSEVSSTFVVSFPAGKSSYVHDFIGYDIGFICTFSLNITSSSTATTPNLIVTAGSATQNVTFGVNVPLSKAKPFVQRYSCEGNEQLPCKTSPAAAGCGWCDVTQSCIAGSTTKGFDTTGSVACTGAQWHPNNRTYYTFSQIMPNQTAAPAQQSKRDLSGTLLDLSLSTLTEGLNATEIIEELLGQQQGGYNPASSTVLVPGPAETTTEYASTTETLTSYSPSGTPEQSLSAEYATSNDNPMESVSTLSSVTEEELSTPTTSEAEFSHGSTTSSETPGETFSQETETSSVSENPTLSPATTQAPAPTNATTATKAPTTKAPTTKAPTTQAATTKAPTTQVPTTKKPAA